jgi:hypothetical protein
MSERMRASMAGRGTMQAAAASIVAIISALLAFAGEVSYADSDPRGTLLTAQALLEHGTFALDSYADLPSDHRIIRIGAHDFYAYPPGTPIAVLPAVAVARVAGFDMALWQDDYAVQHVLAAISVGVSAFLLTMLAVRWVAWPLAAMLAAVFVSGTPVMSTMGTALWSTNLNVVLALGALLLMARCGGGCPGPLRAGAIGAMLGFAFWCRPTAFALGGLGILWIVARGFQVPSAERRRALASTLTLGSAVLVSPILLIAMSRVTYGTWLPDYYAGARVAASERFGTAVAAHLISPSRGLLIFAPIALLAFVVACFRPRRVLGAPLVLLAISWLALHLVVVSRFPHWWGGYSYGSRLMVDVLPAVFVLMGAAAAAVQESSRVWRATGLVALVLAAASGIWINSVQGLFNPATKAWNAWPNIDRFPGYAFDWRAPQFLASDVQLDERMRRHDQWIRPPLDANVDYTAASPRLELRGWSLVEPGEGSSPARAAERSASVRFLVGEPTMRATDRLMLTLGVAAARPTTGEVWFNGGRVAELTVRPEPQYHVIAIPRSLVRTMEYDVLDANVLEWRTTSGAGEADFELRSLRVHPGRRRAL